ncbi:MAG: hypothetical protein FRX48_02346 [Lasallia pustulata]|uniref:Uncharacterized protein n=1 Tax=Lasallia pustulata TaxID=136370 RepID=A0A5M8PY24_9LECA|nr:MAG: hypothetical protein FRX48_02346 [Lasallia pustulata]
MLSHPAIGPEVVGQSKNERLPMSWSSHGDPVSSADGPDAMLQIDVCSNTPTLAAPSSTSSISMSASHLSHEPGPTYPASIPPPQPAQPAGSTTPTEAAGDGSGDSASTNEHQVASTGLDAAARNPKTMMPQIPPSSRPARIPQSRIMELFPTR